MNNKEFALELLKVQRLDFVDQCITTAHEPFVYVELSPRLVELLPYKQQVLTIRHEDFSAAYVIQQYEEIVVRPLTEMAAVAQEMLKSAKAQATGLPM